MAFLEAKAFGAAAQGRLGAPVWGPKIGTFRVIFEVIFWSTFWSPFGALLGSVLGSILAPDGPKKGAR